MSSPNFYYQPCQDALNVDSYLSVPGGLDDQLQGPGPEHRQYQPEPPSSYGFTVNGPADAGAGHVRHLADTIAKGAAPSYCTFTRTATYSVGTGDYVVATTASGDAQGLATGQTNGAGVVKVVPAPALAITLLASRLSPRPERQRNSSGVLDYTNGNATLNRTQPRPDSEIQTRPAWFYLTVVNQGGAANNFSASVTQAGFAVTLPRAARFRDPGGRRPARRPLRVRLPADLHRDPGLRLRRVRVRDQRHHRRRTSSRRDGDDDDLRRQHGRPEPRRHADATADGTNKTVGQAQAMWTGRRLHRRGRRPTRSAALGTLTAITQDQLAYTCLAANSAVVIGAQ